MVIEQFKDTASIGERFSTRGRMLPEGVTYQASWIDPVARRCFQLMEAPDVERFATWTEAWQDLIDFEIIPVVTSAEFWQTVARTSVE